MVEYRQLVWDPASNKWIDQLVDAPESFTDADNLTYSPDGYWANRPETIAQALNQLAASGGGSGGTGVFAYGSLINTSNPVLFTANVAKQINIGWSDGGSFDTTLNVSNGTITTNVASEFVINCMLACQTQVDGSLLQFEIYQNGAPLSFTKVSSTAQGDTLTMTITAMVAAASNDVFSLYMTDNQNETVTINGDFSMFAPGGAQGPAGPRGADGYSPPSGGGSKDYALFFAMMPGDNAATVGVGVAVEFPQDGPTTGAFSRVDSSTFDLPVIGTYEVTWQVSIAEPGQLQLALNGVGLAHTVVGRATGTTQLFGSTIITTTSVHSELSVINPIGNSTALTITPIAGGANAVSATLSIKAL
jgi:hypothetical protein